MAFKVEIDPDSGFCGGVIRAVNKAENFLDNAGGHRLYSIGAIVHNEAELERLEAKNLVCIRREDMNFLPAGTDVLIRAHGEPPSTYSEAGKAGLRIIDCTCPVVLQLQKRIREAYVRSRDGGGQIIIFGKVGHAEVLGLVGQSDGTALVMENIGMLRDAIASGKMNLSMPAEIFSQTTKSPADYAVFVNEISASMSSACGIPEEELLKTGRLKVHDTICRQVAGRYSRLSEFALKHDIIIFVTGSDSSNGKVLSELCRSLNIRTYIVSGSEGVRSEWFRKDDSVGICGATSTPKWLLESVASRISSKFCDSPAIL
jgi:4-hydroxy-3-methylbut-2-en-1-yl diphosphate reductase